VDEAFEDGRDLGALVVPRIGAVVVSEDLWEPVRLIDAAGEVSRPVAAFLKDVAGGRAVDCDAAFLCDGPAAVVSVPPGGGRGVGSSDAARGTGFLPLAGIV
jgi:hypothetical protein